MSTVAMFNTPVFLLYAAVFVAAGVMVVTLVAKGWEHRGCQHCHRGWRELHKLDCPNHPARRELDGETG